MNRESLLMQIHSLLIIWAPNLTAPVRERLAAELGIFVISGENEPDDYDIIIEMNETLPPDIPPHDQSNVQLGISVMSIRGERAFVFSYGGNPEIAVIFSQKTRIICVRKSGPEKRLYGTVLFCINVLLQTKGALLYHGAVAEKDTRCIMLSGHRGTRKTMLLLYLLRDGWDYISDDKCILSGKRFLMFQDFIYIRGHHIRAIPWLQKSVGTGSFIFGSAPLALVAEQFLQRHAKGRFRRVIDDRLNPLIRIEIGKYFTSGKMESASPSLIFILCNGNSFGFEPVQKEKAIDDMMIIQDLLFHKYIVAQRMLAFYDGRFRYDRRTIIGANIPEGALFYRMTVPYVCTAGELHREFIQFLSQVT